MNLTIQIQKEILLFSKHRIELYEISHYQGDLRRNYPYHYHNFYEMSLVVRGKNHFHVNNQTFTCNPGELVLIGPHCLHAVSVDELSPEDSIWTFRLQIDPESELAKRLDRQAVLVPLREKAIFLQNLLSQWIVLDSTSPYATEYVEPFSSLVLHLIFDALESVGLEYADNTDDYYRDILFYIMKNYRQPFNLDDLVEKFAVSKSHLMRCFKQNFGITPIHYRNELLIDESCYELTNTDKSIRQISDELTFDSVPYYLRAFEKFMGLTPTQYRQKFREVRRNAMPENPILMNSEHLGFLYPMDSDSRS